MATLEWDFGVRRDRGMSSLVQLWRWTRYGVPTPTPWATSACWATCIRL